MDEIQQQVGTATAGFNGFDWVIVVIVAMSLLIGLWRGLAKEAFSLIGWAAAFFGAQTLAQPFSSAFSNAVSEPTIRYILSWGLVFVGALAIFSVLGNFFSQQLRQPGLNLGNRILGAAFGVLRGVIVVAILTLILRELIPRSEQDLIDNATLIDVIDEVIEFFGDNLDPILDAAPTDSVGEAIDNTDLI